MSAGAVLPLSPPLSPFDNDSEIKADIEIEKTFIDKCQKGDFFSIQQHLKLHPEHVNVKNEQDNNSTPLHYAVLRKDAKLVASLLLDFYADPNVQVKTGATPLHWAAGFGLSEICWLLIKCGARVDIQDSAGCYGMHMAAQNGFNMTVLMLSSTFGEIVRQDSNGRTALHWAAIKNHVDMIISLCTLASYDTQHATSEYVNIPDKEYGMTALHWASHLCYADACKVLLKFGANPALRDAKGRLPLDLAAAKNFQKYYELALLSSGMTISAKSKLWMRIDPNKAKFWIGKVFPNLHIPYISLVFGCSRWWSYPILIAFPLALHYVIGRLIMPTVPLMETDFLNTMHWSWYVIGWIVIALCIVPSMYICTLTLLLRNNH